MVENAAPSRSDAPRARPRQRAAHAHALGEAAANPLGDLGALDTVNQRFARALRSLFEPMLRRPVRIAADAIQVRRFDDWLDGREGLTSTTLVSMAPLSGHAMLAVDGGLIFELVDLYFGGPGVAPNPLPAEFTPTAEAMVERLARGAVERLAEAWSELAALDFRVGRSESNPALLAQLDGSDRVVVTRFSLQLTDSRVAAVELLYPAAALKPIASTLSSRAQGRRPASADPAWLASLTRAVMDVKLPVRSVLAEPVVPLSTLMNLKPGDVIPISFGPEIPLLVADKNFARGAVGAANGRAAIRVRRLEPSQDEDSNERHDA